MGVKLVVVCGLALLMAIPALFVNSLVNERTKRAFDVAKDIGDNVGGQQTFLGPTLAIPYTTHPQTPTGYEQHGVYIVFPTKANATVKTTTEERHRSLFKVPVFQADLKLDASFDLTNTAAVSSAKTDYDWKNAQIVVGVSNARGARAEATLTTDTGTITLPPSSVSENLAIGTDDNQRKLKLVLFGANVATATPGANLDVSASMKFSGAQRFAVLAYGKTTEVRATGDWPNPGFSGGNLPLDHIETAHGFEAHWLVPSIARAVRAEGPAEYMTDLNDTALGVSFVEVADPYQCVTRSLKYILLFLGLVFLTYFTFEVSTGKRVHPAQYGLVGIAQIIFYLLLLSFAERIGFDCAFLIAGVATVSLLSANAGWIFESRVQAVRAFIVFSLLYALIYFLLKLEDNALLIGACASFAAIAAVMYLTRKLDWYGTLPSTSIPPQVPQPLPTAR